MFEVKSQQKRYTDMRTLIQYKSLYEYMIKFSKYFDSFYLLIFLFFLQMTMKKISPGEKI